MGDAMFRSRALPPLRCWQRLTSVTFTTPSSSQFVIDKKKCNYIFEPYLIHALFVFGLFVFVILKFGLLGFSYLSCLSKPLQCKGTLIYMTLISEPCQLGISAKTKNKNTKTKTKKKNLTLKMRFMETIVVIINYSMIILFFYFL